MAFERGIPGASLLPWCRSTTLHNSSALARSSTFRSEAEEGASRARLEVGAGLSFSFEQTHIVSCPHPDRPSALSSLLPSRSAAALQVVSFWKVRPALACQFGLPPRQDSGLLLGKSWILGRPKIGTDLAGQWVEIILGMGSDSAPSSGRSGGPNKITLLTSEGPPPPGGPLLVMQADRSRCGGCPPGPISRGQSDGSLRDSPPSFSHRLPHPPGRSGHPGQLPLPFGALEARRARRSAGV